MAKFVTIGERLSTTAPSVNKAFTAVSYTHLPALGLDPMM